MSMVADKPFGWQRGRRWVAIGLVLVGQVALIYWLENPPSTKHGQTTPGPAMRVIAPGRSELLALSDPTLFALPHPLGFSGPAWLNETIPPYKPFAWTDAPEWLARPAGQLAVAFHGMFKSDELESPPISLMPIPAPKAARPSGPELFPTISTLRLSGELAERRLLTSSELPSQMAPAGVELLTNSVVQVAVTPEGQTVAAMLLVASGSKEADLAALSRARAARFSPVNLPGHEQPGGALNALSWGEMIFQWHTVARPATNTVPGA